MNHQYETLYEESNGGVRFDLGPKGKDKSNIVIFKSPVAAYLSEIGISNVLTTKKKPCVKNSLVMSNLSLAPRSRSN